MFFIAPRNQPPQANEGRPHEAQDPAVPPNKRKRLFQAHGDFSGYYPKRVPKACDRCRVKKVKCSGGVICVRCEADAVICVTSSATGKDTAPVNPEQLHLVESQRDRLVQILSRVLQRQDKTEAAKLRDILGSMGLSTQMLPTSNDGDPSADIDATTFDQLPQDIWLELYESLNAKDDEHPLPSLNPAGATVEARDLEYSTSLPNDSAAVPDQLVDDGIRFDDLVRWSSFDSPSQQGGVSSQTFDPFGTFGDQDFHYTDNITPAT